jgi:hypothetical protein
MSLSKKSQDLIDFAVEFASFQHESWADKREAVDAKDELESHVEELENSIVRLTAIILAVADVPLTVGGYPVDGIECGEILRMQSVLRNKFKYFAKEIFERGGCGDD